MSFLDLYEGDQAQAANMQPGEGTRLPSGFEANFNAAWSDGRLFGQSIASYNARASAISDYADEVRRATGADLSEQLYPQGGEGGAQPDYDAVNAKVAALKEKNPALTIAPLSDAEIDQRALAKAQAAHRDYETLQAGEKGPGGSVGTFLGSAAASATDPINIVGLAVAPEAAGIGVLSTALRWGAIAGVSQAAIEGASNQFKEQVQPGYTESGEPVTNVAGAFVSGAVLGGMTKALGNAWTRVKTGAWPTSVRDAGNVVESAAHTAQTNPFPGAEGEVAHQGALAKSIDDILAERPVDVGALITPDLLERSRALVDRLQTEQPFALPVINRRAIELAAEQDRLTTRDAELASTLEKLPPGDISAADRLNRLQAVEQQLAEAADPAAKRALSERRDQILVDTNPEALQAAAAPIEARRAAEAERASIASRLQDITDEHTRMQADQSLLGMRLPPLGQRERIPTGPRGQFEFDLQPPETSPIGEASRAPETPSGVKEPPGPPAPLQTPEEMAKTLTAPDHQEAIRADIDRARAMGDVQVPGIDENGNHTMIGVDKAMDEVDAYKAAAEQIQACANPAQETAEPMRRDVTERGRSGRPISSEPLPAKPILADDVDIQNIRNSGQVHIMHDDAGQVRGIYGSKQEAEAARDTAMREIWEENGPTHGDEFGGAPPREWKRILKEWNRDHPDNDPIDFNEAGYSLDGGGGRKYFGGLEGEPELQRRLEAVDKEWEDKPMPYPGARAAARHFRENVLYPEDEANVLSIRKGRR